MSSRYPTTYRGSSAVRATQAAPVTRALAASDFRSAGAAAYAAANSNVVIATGRLGALRALAGVVGRISPYLALGLTLYELYEYFYGDEALRLIPKNLNSSSSLRRTLYDYDYDVDHVSFSHLSLNGWELLEYHPEAQYPPSSWTTWRLPALCAGSYFQRGVSNLYRTVPPDAYPGSGISALHEMDYIPGSRYVMINYFWISGLHPSYNIYYADAVKYAYFFHPLPNPTTFPFVPRPLINLGYVAPRIETKEDVALGVAEAIDPSITPLLLPGHKRYPIPYDLIPKIRNNPWRYYQRYSGYGNVQRAPLYSVPLTAPTLAILSSPSAVLQYPPLTNYHLLRAPPDGVKERKVRVAGYAAVNLFIGSATELLDALNAIYKALPKNLRPRRFVSQRERLEILYENWDKVNVVQAVKNLVYNELQDRLFGAMGNATKQASANLRPHGELPIGFQAGPAL